MFSETNKKLRFVALLALVGAGFSSLDSFSCLEPVKKVFAAETVKKVSKKKTSKKNASEKTAVTDENESMFLADSQKTVDYLPDIFRCPECGYEQDEPGTCPDHSTVELIKILARGRDPLEPGELDGNEDIVVDIPLKNLKFKKDAVIQTATATPKLK